MSYLYTARSSSSSPDPRGGRPCWVPGTFPVPPREYLRSVCCVSVRACTNIQTWIDFLVSLQELEVEGSLSHPAPDDFTLGELIELFVEIEHINTELQVNVKHDQLLYSGGQFLQHEYVPRWVSYMTAPGSSRAVYRTGHGDICCSTWLLKLHAPVCLECLGKDPHWQLQSIASVGVSQASGERISHWCWRSTLLSKGISSLTFSLSLDF